MFPHSSTWTVTRQFHNGEMEGHCALWRVVAMTFDDGPNIVYEWVVILVHFVVLTEANGFNHVYM